MGYMTYKDPEKKRKYQRKWIARRRQNYFLGKECSQCGSVSGLQIDHINPKDKITNSVWSWSEERRQKELAKCQILCEKCHLEKTIKELSTAVHGGDGATLYRSGCRCPLCREAQRKRIAAYRATKNNSNKGPLLQ